MPHRVGHRDIAIPSFASRLPWIPYTPPAFRSSCGISAAVQWICDPPDGHDAVPAVAFS